MRSSALDLRLSKAGVFVRASLESLSLLRNPTAVSFFVPQLVLLLAMVAILVSFHRTPGSVVLAPLVNALGGSEALHYPRFFERLPYIASFLEGLLGGLVLAFGWGAFLSATPDLFAGERPDVRDCWRHAFSRAGAVWAVALPLAGLHVAALAIVDGLRAGELGESPRLLQIAEVVSFGIVALGRVLAAYALPALFLSNRSVVRAFSRSWTLASRNFGITAAFVLTPRLLEIPLRQFNRDLPDWYGTFGPETSGALVALRLCATTVGNAATWGALARFYLHMGGREEEL